MSTEELEEITEEKTTSRTAADWGRDNRQARLFLIILGVAIVLGVGIWLYVQYKSDQERDATMALARIRPVYGEGRYLAALTGDSVPPVGDIQVLGLAEISSEYSGTEVGKNAALLAGHCYVNLNKYSEAKEQYELAQSADAAIVQMGALNGLALCKEEEKDLAGAAALYEQAADKGLETGLAARSLLFAGLAYEKSGDKEKAGKMFLRIVRKYGASESSSAAKMGLARLGMAID